MPGELQDLEALDEELQAELVPSPHENPYCTLWPLEQVDPPVEKV